MTVGIALEAFDAVAATSSIVVFVDLRHHYAQHEFFIDPNTGFVGVGTTSPMYPLTVAGNIGAQGFINISTRDAKKDIEYYTEEQTASALEAVEGMKIASYHYNEEDDNAPMRLGLIAEEAPSEVLSPDGKGVDLYKLNTLTLASVQEVSKQVSGVEKFLGISLEDVTGSSTLEVVGGESLLDSVRNLWDKVTGIETRMEQLEAENAALKARMEQLEAEAGVDAPDLDPAPTPQPEPAPDPQPEPDPVDGTADTAEGAAGEGVTEPVDETGSTQDAEGTEETTEVTESIPESELQPEPEPTLEPTPEPEVAEPEPEVSPSE